MAGWLSGSCGRTSSQRVVPPRSPDASVPEPTGGALGHADVEGINAVREFGPEASRRGTRSDVSPEHEGHSILQSPIPRRLPSSQATRVPAGSGGTATGELVGDFLIAFLSQRFV